ncbi:hypothetical protein [Mariprofundus ferrooxydans]|uniref:hypothetical protein n=1 Tax=Mariprofundus ferrooxydans TaxID=314344 RepID=UPI001431F186|nr:hypothetical protein [Mariprofundus ferrooxydans]
MSEELIAEILKQSVGNVREQFAGFSVDDLEALKAAEADDKNRVTLIEAIDAEIVQRNTAGSDQEGNVPAAPAAPRTAGDIEKEIGDLESGCIDIRTAQRLAALHDELAEAKK